MLRSITTTPLWVASFHGKFQFFAISSTKYSILKVNSYWPFISSTSGFILNARGFRQNRPTTANGRSKETNKIRRSKQKENVDRSHPSYQPDGKHGSENDSDEEDNNNDPREKFVAKLKRFFAISLFAYGVIYLISPKSDGPTAFVSITWSEFVKDILPTGQIHKIVVFPEKDVAFIYTYMGSKTLSGEPMASIYRLGIPSVPRFESAVRAAQRSVGLPPEHWIPIQYRRMETLSQWLTLIFISALLIGSYVLFKKFKGSFNFSDVMSNITKGKYTVIDPHSSEGKKQLKIKFKDVAGCSEAKLEISEFVDYLRNPNKYTKLGAKLPRGALLTGPPGCGKTLIAKALAAESSAPFISMNGTEFVEVIGGLGASRIRGLFKEARSRAPCIIYIDEIDAIGRKRSESKGGGLGGGSNEEEQTLNQLLVEMDGMGSGQGIVVLGSTNRPDILDKALLRPGRFDRHISIDLPTLIERKEMFDLYLKRIKLDHPFSRYSHRLAQMTPGFTANVVNEAAIRAASTGKHIVSVGELEYAMDRVLAGSEKRSRTLVEEEREIVAYHEAGHALVGWLLQHTDALIKACIFLLVLDFEISSISIDNIELSLPEVILLPENTVTIIPRTSAALGFAQYSPKDKKLFAKEELFDRMCMMLGGRAAENIKFGRITTGAEDDLKKVTKSAYAQVKLYGMSALVGTLSFPMDDDFKIKPFSKKFGYIMDQEASSLVGKAYRTTENLLRSNIDKLELIARELLKKEVLNYEDIRNLIGVPPYGDKQVIELVDNILPKDGT
ncbi:ATP-dependent metallopeptidase HflB [Dictyocaulus viviparus]|uniref:ATP-dependent metallopeptidase HflB n=1 Tax=Dictyocaulus viviparus TaxID=29172 RepID=A0A0D8XNL5_DICVI|nr:ATP-dependent metallopeptidase HflB [Dictyocaulus viviparus]